MTLSISMVLQYVGISTHTLTWSVTDVGMIKIRVEGISTHTLTWSVTSFIIFNQFKMHIISTHTLTWSVTIWCSTRF